MVGFINCSHLHAPESRTLFFFFSSLTPCWKCFLYIPSTPLCGFLSLLVLGDGEVRCEQMDMMSKWTSEFQSAARQQDEVVVFDVLCGDFNFDNCSPGNARKHNP